MKKRRGKTRRKKVQVRPLNKKAPPPKRVLCLPTSTVYAMNDLFEKNNNVLYRTDSIHDLSNSNSTHQLNDERYRHRRTPPHSKPNPPKPSSPLAQTARNSRDLRQPSLSPRHHNFRLRGSPSMSARLAHPAGEKSMKEGELLSYYPWSYTQAKPPKTMMKQLPHKVSWPRLTTPKPGEDKRHFPHLEINPEIKSREIRLPGLLDEV